MAKRKRVWIGFLIGACVGYVFGVFVGYPWEVEDLGIRFYLYIIGPIVALFTGIIGSALVFVFEFVAVLVTSVMDSVIRALRKRK